MHAAAHRLSSFQRRGRWTGEVNGVLSATPSVSFSPAAAAEPALQGELSLSIKRHKKKSYSAKGSMDLGRGCHGCVSPNSLNGKIRCWRG